MTSIKNRLRDLRCRFFIVHALADKKRFWRAFLLFNLMLPVLVCGSGCATHALWTESALDTWNEPATAPALHLYASSSSPDFLVVYDEFSDRHETTRPRAYFLYQNQSLLAQKRAPRFVGTNLVSGLSPVPVFCPPLPFSTNQPPRPFAICSTNNPSSFTLYDRDGGSAACHLPVYNDGTGAYKRAALTPLTVTADVTVIGGLVGGILFWEYKAGGVSADPFLIP